MAHFSQTGIFAITLFTLLSFSLPAQKQIFVKYVKQHEKAIIGSRFSPDSKTIACLTADKTIKIYDTNTGEMITVLDDKGEGDVTVAFSPDSRFLAAGSWDKTIKIWDIDKGRIVKRFSGHSQATRSISFNSQGNFLASAGWDDMIKIWYTPTGISLKNMKGHTQCVRTISFSPDGNFIASGSYDLLLKVWDLSTGNTVFSVKAADFPIETLCYSYDGKMIATAGLENAIKLWDATTGSLIKILKGHTDAVYSLAFSPDNKYLVSGGNDNIIKIWKIDLGLPIYDLKGHSLGIRAVDFSQDGKYLLSGGIDKSLKLWDISFLNIPSIRKIDMQISEEKNSELVNWLLPENNPHLSFTNYVSILAQINDPDFKNFQLFLNKTEYTKHSENVPEVVKPSSVKVIYNKGTEIAYDLYIYNKENEVQLYAENTEKKRFLFSKPLSIKYYDLAGQAASCNLRAVFINPKIYTDKKFNSSYFHNNPDNLKGILKTQENKIFKSVTYYEPNSQALNSQFRINTGIDSLASVSDGNDVFVIFISGIFVADNENNIFLLNPNAGFKNVDTNKVDLINLTNTLLKTNSFCILCIDASHKLSKYPQDYTTVNDTVLYEAIVRNMKGKNNVVVLVPESQKESSFYDVFANSLHVSNDNDKNNIIDLYEIKDFFSKLFRVHFYYKGKYLPVFHHGTLK